MCAAVDVRMYLFVLLLMMPLHLAAVDAACSFVALVSLKSRPVQGVELAGLAFVLSALAVAGAAAAALAAFDIV